jgi:hypothetical protein
MQPQSLLRIRSWFASYVKSFQGKAPADASILAAKESHTRRVVEEILHLGRSEKLPPPDLAVAEAGAWLHDTGRFEQHVKFGTFADHRSLNHAESALTVITEHRVLEGVDQEDADIIRQAIRHHNRAGLPARGLSPRALLHCRLLRDADKLDILHQVTEESIVSRRKLERSFDYNLPEDPAISPEVYRAILEGRQVVMKHLRTQNDFRVIRLGWVYDVNFPETFRQIRRRGYFEKIRDVMPPSPERDAIYTKVRGYLEVKIG